MEALTEPRTRTWRRRLRPFLGVRALMALVLGLGVWMGGYVQSVRTQQAAVVAIRKAHGSVTYDWEWGRTNPHIIDQNARPQPPRWFAERVGVDYVGNVVGVDLLPQRVGDPSRANDETMVHVGRLGHLEALSLNQTAVTDEGLARLEGLTSLQSLGLIETPIGDDGLAHLL
ncbi:hypothetical protein ACYOEI_33500, partial [Singulisphaera rosea]